METDLIRFKSPSQFRASVEPFLLEAEAEHNLILGLSQGLPDEPAPGHEPYLAALRRNGEIIQALMCTPPFPVILSRRTSTPSDREIDLVIGDLHREYGDELSGFNGPTPMIGLYVEAWMKKTGRIISERTPMRIYKATAIVARAGVPGQLRKVRESDTDLLVPWFQSFDEEALGEKCSVEQARKRISTFLEANPDQRGLYLWEEDGKAVASTGYTGPTLHGIRIMAVYTPPEFRRRGYASACVAAVSQTMLDAGRTFCFLYTDLRKLSVNRIYQTLGYRSACDAEMIRFTESTEARS